MPDKNGDILKYLTIQESIKIYEFNVYLFQNFRKFLCMKGMVLTECISETLVGYFRIYKPYLEQNDIQ